MSEERLITSEKTPRPSVCMCTPIRAVATGEASGAGGGYMFGLRIAVKLK